MEISSKFWWDIDYQRRRNALFSLIFCIWRQIWRHCSSIQFNRAPTKSKHLHGDWSCRTQVCDNMTLWRQFSYKLKMALFRQCVTMNLYEDQSQQILKQSIGNRFRCISTKFGKNYITSASIRNKRILGLFFMAHPVQLNSCMYCHTCTCFE